jgi:hypothetical protein
MCAPPSLSSGVRAYQPDDRGGEADGARGTAGPARCRGALVRIVHAMRTTWVVASALVALAAACGADTNGGTSRPIGGDPPADGVVESDAARSPRVGPLTPTDPDRVSPEQAAAIAALGAAADRDAPTPGDGAGGGAGAADHAEHAGHSDAGPTVEVALSAADEATFDREWSAAVGAAATLDTVERAAAAGYVQAAAPGPGVGTHWVKWSLVDAPFDAAAPAMLLFEDHADGTSELAGFSYWLRDDVAPEGFAGPNDHWHQHTGVCVVNGWVDREMAAGPEACAGTFLGGADLWMLHAWVVPDRPNRWGTFAVMNPALCPTAAGTPDVARCPTEFTL